MDVYPPASLSPPWQMHYFAEFPALQSHKWLWDWLLSHVHLHHQCRQQERCAGLEERVCVRELLQSLGESTDTGYWCEACKHLKRDFGKAGCFCLQIAGLWSSEFPSFSQGDARFQSSIRTSDSAIALFHIFTSHLTAPNQHTTPKPLQLFSLLKHHQIPAICSSFPLVQTLHDVQIQPRPAAFSSLTPRWHPCRASRIAGVPPAPLCFGDGLMHARHWQPPCSPRCILPDGVFPSQILQQRVVRQRFLNEDRGTKGVLLLALFSAAFF